MPRESKENRKFRARKVFALLKKAYPNARCELNFSNPLELLVATILSAQCTDERVNIVTKDLFGRYSTAADYAGSPPEALQEQIRSIGFFRNKAKWLSGACARIVECFDGEVPDNMEELLSLPGVARKTANVVLGTAFGKNEGIVVDTHVKRVSTRLVLTKHKDPVKIERDLMELIPRKQWAIFGHTVVFHGRYTCTARRPGCAVCAASKLCPSAFEPGTS